MTHFEGKSVPEHLKEARRRGALASAEIHGSEMPGHVAAAADACKETCVVILLLWAILIALHSPHTLSLLLFFSIGWIIWKAGRSSLLGYARMERLHRVIQEERWEIEHHRAEEREELKEMYIAKGFSGKLLEEVLDVMMADDNRLLRIMLEEELGLSLEAYEHPLKQALGAFVGTLVAVVALLGTLFFFPVYGIYAAFFVMFGLSTFTTAKIERNRFLNQFIWSLATAILAFGITTMMAYLE